ncbi:hypothetical protein KM043_013745 [Ampulex compressa]|nr:hypothetical protein KM043_013745 [Ampulex compressa]
MFEGAMECEGGKVYWLFCGERGSGDVREVVHLLGGLKLHRAKDKQWDCKLQRASGLRHRGAERGGRMGRRGRPGRKEALSFSAEEKVRRLTKLRREEPPTTLTPLLNSQGLLSLSGQIHGVNPLPTEQFKAKHFAQLGRFWM